VIDRRKFVERTTRKQVEDNCRKNLRPPIAIAKNFIEGNPLCLLY